MNTPKAILIGFAMVAAAVYFSRDVGPAEAASGTPDYVISSANPHVWVMAANKGKIRHCWHLALEDPVKCSSWKSVDK